MANSVDPDQTAPIGAVCSGSMLFAYILNVSVMLGNYLQQASPTVFKDFKLMKNTDLSVQILLQKCKTEIMETLILEN